MSTGEPQAIIREDERRARLPDGPARRIALADVVCGDPGWHRAPPRKSIADFSTSPESPCYFRAQPLARWEHRKAQCGVTTARGGRHRSEQRASPSWLIGRAEDRTYCEIVIIQRLSAVDLAARNIWTPRRNFAV